MLNKVQLIGNLGDEPKVRITSGGQAVASFSVATNRRWKDRSGDKQEATDWHQVVCWGRRAQIAEKYLSKGRQVYVEGRLQTTSWEDKETGATRYRTEVVCQNLQLLGPAPANGAGARSEGDEDTLPDAGPDDDIPF